MNSMEELCEAVKGMSLDEVVSEISSSTRDIRDPEAVAAFLLSGAGSPAE